MAWERLKKEKAHDVLDKLRTDENAVVFSKNFTEVSYKTLSFYPDFSIYRLINYATMPSFSMQYLSDGNVFISLDGTANPIYAINAEAPIQLTNDNVIEYLDFFFHNVQGSDGDIYIIKTPETMPALNSLDYNQQQSIIKHHVPLTVKNGQESGEFIVHGTIYYGGCLISANIQVSSDGRLTFIDKKLLLQGIDFPQTAVNYYWMGEK